VIDQDGFKPRAQGLFWDIRGAVQQLMRRDAPCTTSLNADAIRAAAGPEYLDQELLDGIQYGMRMPAEHQMCIVLLPNLILIGGACMPQHHADVTRMEADRILSVHASMPFIPCMILSQGSIGKIHEPDKPPHHRRRRPAGTPDVQLGHGDRAHQRQRAQPSRRRQLPSAGGEKAQVRPRARRRLDPQLGSQGAGG
jgi:hypothetical protein